MKLWSALGALALVLLESGAPARAAEPTMRIFQLNDHLLCFYIGRPTEDSVKPGDNSADYGAYVLGLASYVVYRGDRALVFDTFANVAEAERVRKYLSEAGIRHFVVVNSHSHLDHVGGNAVYADSDLIATEKTRQNLMTNKAAIAAGTTDEGLPGIEALLIPQIGITAGTVLMIGDVRAELRPTRIRTPDELVIYLPVDHILLAGDTMEDTVPFIAEPASIPAQYKNLTAMHHWGIERIYPNHGDPDVIAHGGYTTDLIDATRQYLRRLVRHSHDPDFLHQSLDSYISSPVRGSTVHVWWAYRAAHAANLALVEKVWRQRPLPTFGVKPLQ